ncbi:MAG: hypothetical protein ACFFC7_17510 [Candidatus Hermodarchaeota archaeon]
MTSKLYRLDDQKRKSERLLIYAFFGVLMGGLIGVIPFVISKGFAWGAWICCVELGFGIGVAFSAQFRAKGYCFLLFGIIISLGLGAVIATWGALHYLFSIIFWFSYSYIAWVPMGLGIVLGLILGLRVTEGEVF